MTNLSVKPMQAAIDSCWHLLILCATGLAMSMLPDWAHAAAAGGAMLGPESSNSIETVMCNVVDMMTGTTGKAVCIVAIIAVGIGALLGKISWGMALIVSVGVALVFGSATIVEALGASATSCAGGAAITTS